LAPRLFKLVGILPLVAVLIVFLAFFFVGEDLVSLVYLLEFLFGRLVTGIDVGVVLARQLAVSLLYLALGGTTSDA